MCKPVEGFLTDDGKFFIEEIDALRYERRVEIEQKLKDFADRYGHSEMTSYDLRDLLIDHIDELQTILTNKEIK